MRGRKEFANLELTETVLFLRDVLKPGSTAFTVLRNVSRSGMERSIDVYALNRDDRLWLSGRVAFVCNDLWDHRRECIKIGGAGMDMGFAIVNDLARNLYGLGIYGTDDYRPPREVPLRSIDRRRLRKWTAPIKDQSWGGNSASYCVGHRWL